MNIVEDRESAEDSSDAVDIVGVEAAAGDTINDVIGTLVDSAVEEEREAPKKDMNTNF